MESQWFETFFSGIAVEFWIRAMTPEITTAEVDFLEKALELKRGARVLDIPCGHGRHALELARRGARVVVNDFGVAVDGSGASHDAADRVVAEIETAGGTAVG